MQFLKLKGVNALQQMMFELSGERSHYFPQKRGGEGCSGQLQNKGLKKAVKVFETVRERT